MSEKAPTEQTHSIPVDVLAEALAKAMKSTTPTAQLLTGMSEERLARARGDFDEPGKYRVIYCKSPETEATFDALLVPSKRYPHGRIIQLLKYRHPDGMFTSITQGGKCPDGLSPWRENSGAPPAIEDENAVPASALNIHYKHWRWQTYLQTDISRIVGRGLTPAMCVDEKDLKKPWLDARLHTDAAE